MQQIHLGFAAEGIEAIGSQGESEDRGIESNALNHIGLFLGPQSSTRSIKPLNNQVHAQFLASELAAEFLQQYLSTVYVLHPLHSHDYLHFLCSQLYAIPGSTSLLVEDSALIMTVLGIGATLTEHLSWAEVLIEKAKVLLSSLDEVLNLRAIQIPLLMISLPYM